MSEMTAERQTGETQAQWLEDELRQTKAALHKVEHELEQALQQIWNLDSGLSRLEQSIGDARGIAAQLPALQEELRQSRALAERLQDRQNDLAAKTEELGRQQQSELERDRQDRAALLARADASSRTVDQFDSRVRLLEESLRKIEEALGQVKLGQEALLRDMEEIGSRNARNLEAVLGLEHALGKLGGDIEELQRWDAEIVEKVNVGEERLRRQEERFDKLEGNLELPVKIKEELDRARFERQQMVERLGKLETAATEILGRTAEFVQALARQDNRGQAHGGQLMELEEQMRQQREAMTDQVKRLVRTIERQRRRQADALAEEIKELGRNEFSADE